MKVKELPNRIMVFNDLDESITVSITCVLTTSSRYAGGAWGPIELDDLKLSAIQIRIKKGDKHG